MFSSNNKCKVWILAACVSAISITNFSDKSFRERLCSDSMVLIFCNTDFTSQVITYLGVERRKLKTPRRNLLTSG
ncbi:hypothetical protein E2C01_099173 [Portunus trituberculatus]|uniref:Uncharacterized protein n=1 Tax=Portunus trituberculatus TaxID=210409 RepID=A0A5B7JZM2_PORTR|nr:hypothetical protein [Portunus trituberculatus]